MKRTSVDQRVAHLEAKAPAPPRHLSDDDMIRMLKERAATPRDVEVLFDGVEDQLRSLVLVAGMGHRLHRYYRAEIGRVVMGPVEIAADVVSYPAGQEPSHKIKFWDYEPADWGTRDERIRKFSYEMWIRSYLMELLLDGDAEALDLRAKLDRWWDNDEEPDELWLDDDPRPTRLLAPLHTKQTLIDMDISAALQLNIVGPDLEHLVLPDPHHIASDANPAAISASDGPQDGTARPREYRFGWLTMQGRNRRILVMPPIPNSEESPTSPG